MPDIPLATTHLGPRKPLSEEDRPNNSKLPESQDTSCVFSTSEWAGAALVPIPIVATLSTNTCELRMDGLAHQRKNGEPRRDGRRVVDRHRIPASPPPAMRTSLGAPLDSRFGGIHPPSRTVVVVVSAISAQEKTQKTTHHSAGLEGLRGAEAEEATCCVRTVSLMAPMLKCGLFHHLSSSFFPCPCPWEACVRLSPSGQGPTVSRNVVVRAGRVVKDCFRSTPRGTCPVSWSNDPRTSGSKGLQSLRVW